MLYSYTLDWPYKSTKLNDSSIDIIKFEIIVEMYNSLTKFNIFKEGDQNVSYLLLVLNCHSVFNKNFIWLLDVTILSLTTT